MRVPGNSTDPLLSVATPVWGWVYSWSGWEGGAGGDRGLFGGRAGGCRGGMVGTVGGGTVGASYNWFGISAGCCKLYPVSLSLNVCCGELRPLDVNKSKQPRTLISRCIFTNGSNTFSKSAVRDLSMIPRTS